ncbi:hypothetical protein [Bacillus cereus]|uniref:hypothetical protein n=1 Tax=Bacillus cereus TaxID=1396 RepID=UPI001879C810|nr:hypothetical protein [Bacillus cereus]MBE7099146.1 hypothetical protein [Bacillus cereus]
MEFYKLITVSNLRKCNIIFNLKDQTFFVGKDIFERTDFYKKGKKEFSTDLLVHKTNNRQKPKRKENIDEIECILKDWKQSWIGKDVINTKVTLSIHNLRKYSVISLMNDTKFSINSYFYIIGNVSFKDLTINFSTFSIDGLINELNKAVKYIIKCDGNSEENTIKVNKNNVYNLLLNPFVASIFFHEFIGHGLEEGYLKKGNKVGPVGLDIYTINSDNTYVPKLRDTERKQLVVRKGIVLVNNTNILGINKSVIKQPKNRLNSLSIGNRYSQDRVPNSYILCSQIGFAQFYKGNIIIEIKNGLLIEANNRVGRIENILIQLNVSEVHKHLSYIYNDFNLVNGICTKYNDTIPTTNRSPSVLLTNMKLGG